jgi:hypothetical protein
MSYDVWVLCTLDIGHESLVASMLKLPSRSVSGCPKVRIWHTSTIFLLLFYNLQLCRFYVVSILLVWEVIRRSSPPSLWQMRHLPYPIRLYERVPVQVLGVQYSVPGIKHLIPKHHPKSEVRTLFFCRRTGVVFISIWWALHLSGKVNQRTNSKNMFDGVQNQPYRDAELLIVNSNHSKWTKPYNRTKYERPWWEGTSINIVFGRAKLRLVIVLSREMYRTQK